MHNACLKKNRKWYHIFLTHSQENFLTPAQQIQVFNKFPDFHSTLNCFKSWELKEKYHHHDVVDFDCKWNGLIKILIAVSG